MGAQAHSAADDRRQEVPSPPTTGLVPVAMASLSGMVVALLTLAHGFSLVTAHLPRLWMDPDPYPQAQAVVSSGRILRD